MKAQVAYVSSVDHVTGSVLGRTWLRYQGLKLV